MQKTALVKIEGRKPLLFNAFKEEALDRKKSKSGTTGNNPDEWEATVIMDEKRRLYLPDNYLFAPIKEAGRYSKIGRGNIIKYIAATLEISPSRIYLDNRIVPEKEKVSRNDTDPVYLDVRSVVNPMTKGRNMRYRIACPSGWKCEFSVSWDDSIMSTDQMKRVVKDAGTMCGTGCGRAIGLGRFNVIEFKITQ